MSRTFAYARVSTFDQTPENQIREIETADSIIINKVGRHFARIRKIIEKLKLTDVTQVVENATTEFEVARPLAQITTDDQPYFTTILIYKGKENWS